ncbi:MAG TPA: ABC transporter permease [Polyangiaceae bacterium]|nr:ABC transporter permease [Polyangiaceae bacterium]
MGFPLELALRYMRSKKRAFISVGTLFATLGVALGVAALATVISVTGGFRAQFRDKVLGVNAHVLVLKYSSDFREYRKVMEKMKKVPGVTGVAPFVINPMMVTHGRRTATGVLLKGVDPGRVADVLDLPRHIVRGKLAGMRLPDAKPSDRRRHVFAEDFDDSSSDSKKKIEGKPDGKSDSASPPEKKSVLSEIEKAVKREAQADATSRASDPTKDGEKWEPPADNAAGQLPAGAVMPEGGYKSVLPDDDVLPADIDPDPCASENTVAKLPGIVLGVTLAKNLAVDIGGCVQVTSPTIGFSYSRGAIRAPVAKQFRVIAVFDAGFDQYDSKLVYTDLYEAQAFYDTGDSVTGIEMKVSNIDAAKAIAQDIDERLGNGVYHTMDWEELNHGLFTALRIQQILMSLVLALIIIVAAFTVIATLIMVVLDKKKEIAVLKAMGATDGALLRSFVYQGTLIGVVGTALGLVLGFVMCKWLLVYGLPLDPKVYFISKLPVQMRLIDFVLVGVFAILVCLIATVWPAFHASRLRPAEAFREN